MPRLSYDHAETLIYDPVAANRNATRAALYMLGFRHIESVSTLDAMAEQIEAKPPDLVLCDAQSPVEDLCVLIQNMRRGAAYNPYLVIIITAWEMPKPLVDQVLNSGADDLLLRPFSVAQLGQRVRSHVEHRKGFVITSDYIGPDRRSESKRPSNIDLFQPPNSLKMKSMDGLSGMEAAARLEGELRTAREVFDGEKLRRDTFQVCVLWRLLQIHAPNSPIFSADLERLIRLVRSIAERCKGNEYAAANRWCEDIMDAVDDLAKGADRAATLQQLGKSAVRLGQNFEPNTLHGTFMGKLDAALAVIRARLEPSQTAELAS